MSLSQYLLSAVLVCSVPRLAGYVGGSLYGDLRAGKQTPPETKEGIPLQQTHNAVLLHRYPADLQQVVGGQ